MYEGKSTIVQLLLIVIHSTFGQDINSTWSSQSKHIQTQNSTPEHQSNITWIRITPITPNNTRITESEHSNVNCTIVGLENLTNGNDMTSNLRRKRRKRRRNKYKVWNQRRPEYSYKKHSTRVQLDKPIQFLVPPDYEENLIPKESTFYKNRNDPSKKFVNPTEKKIIPPARYLLPPYIELHSSNSINFTTPVPYQRETKQSKNIEWSPNSTNRGSTKFKHTIYYSDSGNEIISNYEVTSTMATPVVKYTSNNNNNQITHSRIEPSKNPDRLEYRPIVVQPTPIQYHPTQSTFNITLRPKGSRVDSLVSPEVASAGMQVINMTTYQSQNVPSFENQIISFKPAEQLPSLQRQVSSQKNIQHTQTQQPFTQQVHHQKFHPQTESYTQMNNQRINHQPILTESHNQNFSPRPGSSSQTNIPQTDHHQAQIEPQLHQINNQKQQERHQYDTPQNYQQSIPQQHFPQTSNHQQSQIQQHPNRPLDQQYQQIQLSSQNTISHPQNFQQTQSYPSGNLQHSLQNYQQQLLTTPSETLEIRTTTSIPQSTTNQTTYSQIDRIENFKGLDLAESKYFSDIPSEQEFTAVQNDGQVIPGIAGKDYPVFNQFRLQKRRFSCRGLEGYFADVTSRCQVFYICNGDGAGEPMLCPNGTLFSQELLVCDWWYNVDC